jgi:hypothetical protein
MPRRAAPRSMAAHAKADAVQRSRMAHHAIGAAEAFAPVQFVQMQMHG